MIANDGKVNLRGNAGLRLMVLFGAFSVCFLVLGGILLGLSAACGGDQNHTYMMLTSALQCLIVFCLLSMVVCKIFLRFSRWLAWVEHVTISKGYHWGDIIICAGITGSQPGDILE